MPDQPKFTGSRRIKRIRPRGGKAGRWRFPVYDVFRYAFIGLLCVVLAAVFQEAWLEQRDYLALERARRLMESITPTPAPEPTPAPTPGPVTAGPTASPTPVPTPTPRIYVINGKFDEFLRQNSDVVGWITIADTPIDYPVLQGDDNEYYLHHSIDGSESKTGSLFLDYRCDIRSDFPPHYIIYGHRMKNGTMFKGLIKFMDKGFFYAHPVFAFDTLYEDMTWEIFSAYITNISDPYIRTDFDSPEEWLAFITELQRKSLYETGVALTADDIVLTLSTCTYEVENGRFVVHARLIRDGGDGESPPDSAG